MISLIAAVAQGNVIGKGNDLPWHLPEDLKYFKRITAGKTVIMGRKTWDSIFARIKGPLPKRTNIVVSSSSKFEAKGATVTQSLADAIQTAISEKPGEEIFIIGGATIYQQAITQADRLYLTEIDLKIEGDAFFPSWPRDKFYEVSRESHPMGASGNPAFDFVLYERHIRGV